MRQLHHSFGFEILANHERRGRALTYLLAYGRILVGNNENGSALYAISGIDHLQSLLYTIVIVPDPLCHRGGDTDLDYIGRIIMKHTTIFMGMFVSGLSLLLTSAVLAGSARFACIGKHAAIQQCPWPVIRQHTPTVPTALHRDPTRSVRLPLRRYAVASLHFGPNRNPHNV
jgi:hypothetical protein